MPRNKLILMITPVALYWSEIQQDSGYPQKVADSSVNLLPLEFF